MKKTGQIINKISVALQKVELMFGSLCLFLLLLIMLVNVVMRYVLAKPLFWADEVNNYLFVWFALLGVAYIMGNNGHLRITSLISKLPAKAQRILSVAVNMIMIVFFAIFTFSCVRLLGIVTFSGILRIPLKYIYLILPLSFGLMCFHLINNTLQLLWPMELDPAIAENSAEAAKGE